MNCKTFSLSEVVETVIDNRGLTPKKLGGDWSDGGYRVISAKNIKNRSLVQEDKIRTIDDSLYSRWMDDDIHRGDIILTSEAPCGETLFWDSDEKIVLGQRLFGIRVKKGYDPYYLFLYLNTRGFQNELSSRMTGTTVQGIRQSELMKCRLYLPSYDVQVAVTKQIKPIDDLIRLNDRINDYLFELCKSLFNKIRKESNDESALSTFAEVCYGKDHKELSDGTIPVFGSGGIMRYSNKALYDGEESVLIPRKGSLNNILYVSDPFWSVDTMFYTKIKRKYGGKYLYFFLRTIDMELMNAGSAVPSMTTEILNEFMIPDPGDDILEYFDTTIQPIFDLIKNNNKTIKTLEICRQTMIKRLFTAPTTISSD